MADLAFFAISTQPWRESDLQSNLRDYYSKTTYYRLFIAEMFTEYTKAVYIDSDTIVQGDISEFFNTDIKDAYVGACHEQVMIQMDVFGNYVEKVIGVSSAGEILVGK